jgi:signal transduction histidine kinase
MGNPPVLRVDGMCVDASENRVAKSQRRLQTPVRIVDQPCAMHTFKPRHDGGRNGADAGALSVREIAHELNSLLDGSMRSIRLAERALSSETVGETREALRRLHAAQQAMGDLARVLGRVMTDEVSGVELLRTDRTLGEDAERVVAALRPVADRSGVTLTLVVHPDVADMPSGPLAAILTNGVRNAIEACAAGGAIRRVEASVAPDDATGGLTIHITDTGPGLPGEIDPGRRPGGHGLGLAVCRTLVSELGGVLTLSNVPFGRGAVLRIDLPRTDLTDHE